MRIVFRADSAIHIGTGHVMRCLVLAKELQAINQLVEFAMWQHDSDMCIYVEQQGFRVHRLKYQANATPKFDGDYENWLPVSQEQDATCFINTVKNADIVIVDHYSLDISWEKQVSQALTCKMIAIDDLMRPHLCDLLLDQTLNRKADDYKALCPAYTEMFTDTPFALLNSEFSKVKQEKLESQNSLIADAKLLVSMGGIDNTNITRAIIQQLVHHPLTEVGHISVIMSPKSPHYEGVKEFCNNYEHLFTQYDFIQDMAQFMSEHQLAIGAPGGSTWERACLGIPSVIIPIADNQKDICQQLVSKNAALKVEANQIETELCPSLKRITQNYQSYREKNYLICDGLGAKRVTHRIKNLLDDSAFFRCRIASEQDIEQTYQWQTLPETRKFALTKSVPSFTEHKQWMLKKLNSSKDYYYVIEIILHAGQVTAAGVVRLDKSENGNYIVSIYVDPQYFGKGIASAALNYIGTVHDNLTIEATVLKENRASQALFKKAGYQQIKPELFLRKANADKNHE